ncbi:MAG: hypothetical protein CSA50_08625 [Gammaproteobacteria bacterium]|nr:MAG: hypothetical protein CSA50_08625 [Gammaproteobacteria bacterium]
MKHSILSSSIALVIGSSATLASAVTLYDYKEATSAYEDAYVNGQFDLQSGNQDQSSYNLELSADYERVFSSPDQNTKIDFSGNTSRNRGPNEGDKSEKSYQATGSITSDQYFTPGSSGAFWYGKGEIGARTDMEDPFTAVTLGVGYGRVVNATPMIRAIRLIEALQERGLLQGAPSVATYQAIAEVIAKESEYRSRYGSADYQMEWMSDIESALGRDLNVRGTIRIYDVLNKERISTRKYGWLVRAGVGSVISNYDGSDSKPALEVGAEYHYPISNSLQFSNETLLTTVIDDGEDSLNAQNRMALTYEISDRIDWENGWQLDYSGYEGARDITMNTLISSYRYYLSNELSFDLTGKLTHLDDDISDNDNDEISKSLTMGVTYRLK